MKTIVVLIIAIFALGIILFYVFSAQGGPFELIQNLLGFMNTTTEYVESTGNI